MDNTETEKENALNIVSAREREIVHKKGEISNLKTEKENALNIVSVRGREISNLKEKLDDEKKEKAAMEEEHALTMRNIMKYCQKY